MNGGSHHEFNYYDPLFMWDERIRIYGVPGVHNNFSVTSHSKCVDHIFLGTTHYKGEITCIVYAI